MISKCVCQESAYLASCFAVFLLQFAQQLKEFKMLMLNTQLSKVYFDETLKNAAQARADRKAQNGGSTRNNITGLFFLLFAAPFMFWLFQSLIAG